MISKRSRIAAAIVAAPIVAAGLAAPAALAAQEAGKEFSVVHCYVAELAKVQHSSSHLVYAITFRGNVRNEEAGGFLDLHASNCVGSGGMIDGVWRTSGHCDYIGSDEDRLLMEWSHSGGQGIASFVHGTGKYRGLAGQAAFTSMGDFPRTGPTTQHECSRIVGIYMKSPELAKRSDR